MKRRLSLNWKKILRGALAAAALCVGLGLAGPAQAASLTWGSCSECILNGGVMAEDSDGTLYYADTEAGGALSSVKGEEETRLTADAAANINVMDGTVYYTAESGSGSAVYAYRLSTGAKSACFTLTVPIDEMYVDSEKTIWYLAEGKVYRRAEGETKSLLVDGGGDIEHFIPTSFGTITAKGSVRDYTLYADGQEIAGDVSSFYDSEGYLIFSSGGTDYQAKLSSLFDGDPAQKTEEYSLGDSALAPLSAALDSDDCEICEENADDYAEKYGTAVRSSASGDSVSALTAGSAVSGLYDASVSDGQRNIVLRARQQHEIAWTPVKDIKGWNSSYTFQAGTTYTGLPYGQPVNCAYVPWNASLDEFAAAVKDSGSKMYTSYSSYNKRAPYYSCDCSSFVSWAWNLSSRQTTSTLGNYATKVSSQSIYSAQIGDAFVLAGSHTVLVTDLGYDADGNLVYVDIMEQTPPQTKLTRWGEGGASGNTLEALTAKYLKRSGSNYILYRSKTRDSVTYTPSSAVTLSGETEGTDVFDLDPKSLVLDIGEYATISYDDTEHAGTARWSSSDESVATVSDGMVRGIAGGRAQITLTIGSTQGRAIVYVRPAKVILKAISNTTKGGLTLTWNSVTGATKYEVLRKNAEGSWVSVGTTTKTSYTEENLDSLTSYTYTVRAVMVQDGMTYYGAYDSTGLTGTTLLAAPKLNAIKAVSTTSQRVRWNAVAGADGYKVYRIKSSGKKTLLGTTTKSYYTVKSRTTGTSYTYTVQSYYTKNGQTVDGGYDPTGVTKVCCPPTPTLSSAECDANGKIVVSWKKVSNVTGYRLYRKTAGGKWKRITTTSKTSYTDTSVQDGTTYIYTVKAYKTVSKKKIWGDDDSKGLECKAEIPKTGTPKLSSAVCDSLGQITLTWKKVTGAEGYRVYRKSAGGKWKRIATLKGRKKVTLTDTGLTYGTEYIYTVKAYRTVLGKKVWSSSNKTGITCKVDAPAVTGVKASLQDDGTVKVRWSAASGVRGYRVYYRTAGSSKWRAVSGLVTKSSRTKTVSGLEAGKTYEFAVRSYWKKSGKRYYSSTYAQASSGVTIPSGETEETAETAESPETAGNS